MKRFARWTTVLAAAVCFAGAAASAQQTPSTSPSPNQPATAQTHRAPQEHLNDAKAALDEIPAASLTGTAASRVAELRRHLSALERAAATHPGHGAATSDKPAGSESWSTDVAAIDRIVTELLTGSGASGANQPAGTSGTSSAPSPAARESSTALDESARTRLQQVRTHIAAFAASMRGSGSAGAAHEGTSPAAAATTPSPTETPASATGAPGATSPTGTPAAEQAQTTPGTSTPATAQSAAPQAAAQDADPDAAKRHLIAARNTLSEVTQLPAAAELTGEARTQVSQLITNFNELITANVDWRASYAKVVANLTTLIGDQRTNESAATQPAGTPGAVGTSGTIALDPAIRAKLVEFRAHLQEFEKSAGGSTAAAGTTGDPSTSAANNASSTSTLAQAGTAGAAATTGSLSTQDAPAPTGTSGTSAPEPQTRPAPARAKSTDPDDSKEEGHAEAMRHIEAIETILNGRAPDRPTGTSGTPTADRAAGLDNDEIQQIRSHLAELRRLLGQR